MGASRSDAKNHRAAERTRLVASQAFTSASRNTTPAADCCSIRSSVAASITVPCGRSRAKGPPGARDDQADRDPPSRSGITDDGEVHHHQHLLPDSAEIFDATASLLPEGVVTRIEADAGGRMRADAEATVVA